MKPIRILQVLGRLDRGGAESMIMNLYHQMDTTQIQFDFILHTNEECDYNKDVRKRGGMIYCVPPFFGTNILNYKKAWNDFFKKHKQYKVVHCHIRSTASIIVPIAQKYGCKVIVHSHNTSSGTGITSMIKTIMQLPIRKQADYLFACSKQSGEWLFGKKACQKPNFHVLPNAINVKAFRFTKENQQEAKKNLTFLMNRKQNNNEPILIGHIGRFEQQKNHKFLIEIAKEMLSLNKNVYFFFIGTGEKEQEIKQLVERYQLQKHILFLGTRRDVPLLLQGMDLLLFPSLFEGLPVTLVEAQASGLPILCSDVITKESVLTDLVFQESLNSPTRIWAERALEIINRSNKDQNKRTKYSDEVCKSGYGIEQSAHWLADFYKKISQ